MERELPAYQEIKYHSFFVYIFCHIKYWILKGHTCSGTWMRHPAFLLLHLYFLRYFVAKSWVLYNWLIKVKISSSLSQSQSPLVSRLRTDWRNSALMMCDYHDLSSASDWSLLWGKFASTNLKHCQILGSNICGCSSGVISWGNQLVVWCITLAVFSG